MATFTINIPTSLPSLPVSAELSGPKGAPLAVSVGANVGGTGTPISLEAGLRHTTVMFRLFGFIPLLTIKVR